MQMNDRAHKNAGNACLTPGRSQKPRKLVTTERRFPLSRRRDSAAIVNNISTTYKEFKTVCCWAQASEMKNPHVIGDQCSPTAREKKFKRKVRSPLKHVEEKDKHDSRKVLLVDEELVDDVYGNMCEKDFVPAGSNGEHIQKQDIVNTALDLYSLPTITGTITETQPRSIFEGAVEHNGVKTLPSDLVFESRETFPKDYAPQSRIVLCKRSDMSVSSTSRAPYISNSVEPIDLPRKRLGEQSGVVTEIKAIQQTRRLLANARERTRVHTISAAFEALRKQVSHLYLRTTHGIVPINSKIR